MRRWESLSDQRIREGIEQGEFDDLSGKGKPIDLSENPFEDPDWRTAHRMLRNAGFAPAWIEERKEIEAELEAARNQMSRAWAVLQNARGTLNERGAGARWEKARTSFQRQIGELNRRVAVWNLKVPGTGFKRGRISAEREIERLREGR